MQSKKDGAAVLLSLYKYTLHHQHIHSGAARNADQRIALIKVQPCRGQHADQLWQPIRIVKRRSAL